MCGAGLLDTDWRGPAARPRPGASGYSLLSSHSVLPSAAVGATRYGGTAVGDARGRVARFQSGRLAVGDMRGRMARLQSGRLRLRRARVGDQQHAWHCVLWGPGATSCSHVILSATLAG